MRIARRAGMNKAKVALARKLAVILHRMLATATPFNDAAAALIGRRNTVFGRPLHTRPSRSEVPAGTMDQVRPTPIRRRHLRCDHAHRRLAGLSSTNPIRRRPLCRPGRSKSPASGSRKKGIDLSRPVTEASCAKKSNELVTTGTPEHPAFPARWFYGLLRDLPGDRAFLSPSPRNAKHCTQLTSASRRQDHTTSPSALPGSPKDSRQRFRLSSSPLRPHGVIAGASYP